MRKIPEGASFWDLIAIRPVYFRDWPEVFRVAIAIISVVLILFFVVSSVGLLFRMALRAFEGAATTEEIRNYILTVAAALGVPFFIWRSYVAHWQATAAIDQVRISSDVQSTNVYAKAVELLGSYRQVGSKDDSGDFYVTYEPNIEARIGAIFSLERLMNSSRVDAKPAAETMAAYLREHLKRENNIYSDDELRPPSGRVRPDCQAAFNVLGRRTDFAIRYGPDDIDLSGIDARRYELDERTFVGVIFSESIIGLGEGISESKFINCYFVGTIFQDISTDDCVFDGSKIIFCSLEDTSFIGCSFVDAEIWAKRGTNVIMIGCDLRGADARKAFSTEINNTFINKFGEFTSIKKIWASNKVDDNTKPPDFLGV